MDLGRLLAAPMDVLVPPTCAGCGLPGAAVCGACARALVPPDPPRCARCAHPWAVAVPTCVECPPRIDRLRYAGAYDGPVPALVTALKDRGRRSLAVALAASMVRADPTSGRMPLVPVPLGAARRAQRGFNQAELLGRAIAAATGASVLSALERVVDRPPQRGSSVSDRADQVRGAFRVAADLSPPPSVCLVDDVCTTGATLAECARTLRRAGVRRVDAVCVARVMRHR